MKRPVDDERPYTAEEIAHAEGGFPERGALCERCRVRVPAFASLDDDAKSRLIALADDGKPVEAMRELERITGCGPRWSKIWVIHRGVAKPRFNGPPCPRCGGALASSRALQCLHCGADWHATRGVEIHDAMVVGTIPFEGGIVLQLHVFVHNDWENGNGSGVWQRIDLRCWGAKIEREGNGEPWALDGYLKVNEVVTENMIPVPFDGSGEITLQMEGADFSLTLKADRMVLEFAGPPETREPGVP